MHLPSLLVALGVCACAAPVDQKPLAANVRHHAGPHKVQDPYTPDYRDPYDKKVDAETNKLQPLPWRNGEGATMLGPRNRERERQNPDMIRPPSTDHGNMPNMRWSFADSHIRIEEGGWTRQTTIRELPTSKELAGVNMRLDEGVIRELHWHKEAEWAYVLEGSVRITVLDTEGGSYVDDLEKGDLWYFPSGHPHSLQGLSPNGTEFLIVFDDGNFSEDSTFLLTDWVARTPKQVLAENFRVAPEVFDAIPQKEKYIFQGSNPDSIEKEIPSESKGYKKSKQRFTHKMLAQEAFNTTGGTVRITDSGNFPVSKSVAAAHLSIHPGAIREMHWHPNADEWSYFIKGRARVTIFAAEGTARTFDYQAGDVGIVPKNMGHFIENLSDEEDVEVLEIFRSDKFQDFSLFQWMGETPQRLVREHLFANDKKSGEKFEKAIASAEKDPIRSVLEDDEEEKAEL
ncbi:Bicupin, oxalate decarboxylase/oxidase [Dothidotthia symphoricarpi CBS 119687]|uniref:Bicupin, oxalate decarboxylase/oxidase n=1 Tax=Dothidotthia symphoricarpi CBS 119687 TaxID=1392245 RepID=A0A6A6AF65_9PLEO|nr:Bicupin, oxalate decarboxylase/oxidase [Dothidotthia symphoricarpi CBS 119687]KAF2129051.1 Bicupin, oxalate decarboxylase/oxidase [Dothidotthia symphoricarpi CBS 119687]